MPDKYRTYRSHDGSFAIIETGFVFGDPVYESLGRWAQHAYFLSWVAAVKERNETLSPKWAQVIRKRTVSGSLVRWQCIVSELVACRYWIEHQDGSITVCRVSKKHGSLKWKVARNPTEETETEEETRTREDREEQEPQLERFWDGDPKTGCWKYRPKQKS